MDILIQILTAVWVLGLAAVFGGFFHQIQEKSKDVTKGMLWGSIGALIAGVVLVILQFAGEAAFADDTHMYVLAGITVVTAVLAFVFRAKKNQAIIWFVLGLLSALGLVIGIFW